MFLGFSISFPHDHAVAAINIILFLLVYYELKTTDKIIYSDHIVTQDTTSPANKHLAIFNYKIT